MTTFKYVFLNEDKLLPMSIGNGPRLGRQLGASLNSRHPPGPPTY